MVADQASLVESKICEKSRMIFAAWCKYDTPYYSSLSLITTEKALKFVWSLSVLNLTVKCGHFLVR